ncbi:MAG: hypothetical protein GEU79_06120 [Acidimicrobiia bacterium]|nr:hypothetical protein [Acidimicrobiia bacterium]
MDQGRRHRLEIDEGLSTQHAMIYVEGLGRVVMALVVLAALLGLLGRSGPLNSRQLTSEAVTVTHDRFARIDAVTAIGISVKAAGPTPRVVVGDSYLDKVTVEEVQPEPHAVVAVPGGTAFDFAQEGADPLFVRFSVKPPNPGFVAGTVTVGEDSFSISQLVYP